MTRHASDDTGALDAFLAAKVESAFNEGEHAR